jgi:16S rRNA (cytidine1402-2'-O)-methyltransferase
MVIDNYEWFTIHKAEEEIQSTFREKIKEKKNIGIISEAGCPGIADPGQLLVAVAQEMNETVKPLVGPSSILLALMASGMNGQQFAFNGYLPIDNAERIKAIRDLESESAKRHSSQVFIETPYRNNQLIEVLVKTCKPSTRLCVAANLTGENEWIKTKTIAEWKTEKTDLHKQPVIYIIKIVQINKLLLYICTPFTNVNNILTHTKQIAFHAPITCGVYAVGYDVFTFARPRRQPEC